MELKNVTISRQSRVLVKDLSLELQSGELLGIVGPNGAGKSTLMAAMAGQYDEYAGSISAEGQCVRRAKARARARLLGYLPQKVEAGLGLRVSELVELGRFSSAGNILTFEDKQAVSSALTTYGIAEIAGTRLGELSGGQVQRAFLAMLHVQDAPRVLLDEPLNHLDFVGQRDLLRQMAKLCQANRSVVMVAHDINSIARRADRVLLLSGDGHWELGSPINVLNAESLSRAYGEPVSPEFDSQGMPFIAI